MDMIWVWTIVIGLSLIIEFLTMEMVSIWLAVGGIFGLILCTIEGVSIEIQIIVAVAVAVVSILCLRKFAMKFLNKTSQDNKAEILIGRKAKLLEKVDGEHNGTLKLNGTVWTTTSDEKIEANTEVEIVEVLGNKLKVKTIKDDKQKNKEITEKEINYKKKGE